MRIPGPSTDQPVNRYEEAAVYRALNGQSFCEEVLFFDPENGYKITAFLDVTGTCDAQKEEDVSLCMRKLREFHELNLSVDHEFDIFRQIDFYESLWSEPNSVYRDYSDTKKQIWSLRPFIQAHAAPRVLTHIDPVPDNFLFARNANGELQVHLIDWEYAGMQDPHVDLAMFCIYALYDRTQVDRLIDLYFPEGCNTVTRIKIYCYIAACGLLWSNWCEYKRGHGVEFGAYSIAQYRYAKEYFRIAQKEIQKIQSKQIADRTEENVWPF